MEKAERVSSSDQCAEEDAGPNDEERGRPQVPVRASEARSSSSVSFAFGHMSTSRTVITIAALPGLVMLALFYSLALHMHQSLGGWPTSIGERGFPPALVVHSAITVNVFIALFLSLFVLPIPILVCLLVERWRRFAVYFAVYAGVFLLCFALTQFAAPSHFLYWWRD